MISLEQIPIIYQIVGIIGGIIAIIVGFIKIKPFLDSIVKGLITKIKQIIEFVKVLPILWAINTENSNNYEKMIDFKIYQSSIITSASGSPYLDIYYYISNRSIFDFKIKKIFMEIYDNESSYAGKIETSKQFELSHQQIVSNNLKSDLLNINFEKLKLTKKECKSLEIDFKDVKIDLTGYKDFCVSYGSFPMMISPARININK